MAVLRRASLVRPHLHPRGMWKWENKKLEKKLDVARQEAPENEETLWMIVVGLDDLRVPSNL